MHGRADIGALRRRGSSSEPIPLRKVKNRRAGSSSNTPQSLLTCAPLGRPGIGAASDVDQYEPSCGPLQPLMAPQAPRGRTVHIFPAKLRRARPPSASSGVAVRTTEEARLRGRHPKKGVSYKCFNRVKETLHEARCYMTLRETTQPAGEDEAVWLLQYITTSLSPRPRSTH